MLLTTRSWAATVLFGLAALIATCPVAGQARAASTVRVTPSLPSGQTVRVANLAQATSPAPAFNPAPLNRPASFGLASPFGILTSTANPYGSGAYNNPYYPSGYGVGSGELSGVADATQANSQYQVVIQQGRLVQSQADMSRLDARQRLRDQERYERSMMPNPEEVRRVEMRADLSRARHEPPLTDIWSAKSLNDLYIHLADELSKAGKGQPFPDVPIDEDVLKHINLTTSVGGSVGVLKDEGKLQWPLPLLGADFQAERKRLERHTSEIVQRLKFGNLPEAATLKDLQADLNQFNETLARSVAELSPSQFIEAKRYLNQLDNAVKALHNPNVANFFTRKWVAEGRTVVDLVRGMSDKGLRFAPAAVGDEPAYRALYQALSAFDAGMAPTLNAVAK